ncbi:MAG: adenylate/guanylate cyclase domain-containing protein, partial [Thermoleophilia bacterium]|nr:adenylate/guanylate cyclase domain-containing protein [Thermoleophilia bacterium]
MTRQLPTGNVTFLFTDVEGSTRLLEELGAERYAGALAEHRRLLREAFAHHGGVEVDTQGDAFFVAFGSADEALAAAERVRATLQSTPIQVRIGLHTGAPLVTGDGYVGMDVHRGARIAAAGHGGQVLVSETTASALSGGDGLRDLGEQRLKDLGAPIRLYQLGDGDFPPLKVLYRSTLPVQPSPLVGRERELDEVAALLAENRVVTLTGPGGSGKTRLALQVAADAQDDFPDGVYWVPLQTIRDPELVLPAIAQAVEAQGPAAEHIADRRVLLVLDNLEQVLEAAADIAQLLAATPNAKAVSTSREPLRIAGEREYAVEPLPLDDAVSLFRERAAVAEPADVVREICRRLDCLPLAVELAAARTKLLPPVQLLGRLEQALPLLTAGRRDAPERQRTLRATIAWSFDLLTPPEQDLFRRLSVFAGSFDLAAAERVCDAELDTLQSLLEKNLVRRWESGRFGMLETIHEYAGGRLEESGDAERVRDRHAAYFLELAESA